MAKNNIIWIVLVLVGVILFFKGGFLGSTTTIKTPLKLTEIQEIIISDSFFIPKQPSGYGGGITFTDNSVNIYEYTYPNTYQVGGKFSQLKPIIVYIFYSQMNSMDKPYIDITYDGGKKLRLFIPPFGGGSTGFIVLWFATDGSSYYDPSLTELARATESQPYQCIESWLCASWSSCTNNQQTRTCTDSNNCGTTTSKPALTQSCTSAPICTQEAGQLCNPATKQLTSFTDGCQKSTFLNQGYVIDLSICTQTSCVTNQQLLNYISTWVNNQLTNQQLLGHISSWVNC